MSSHHIVREKQEPALLILNLEDFENEHLGQILEWSPTVIVSEDIFEKADSMGFKVDMVISSDPDFKAQENTRIILTEEQPLEDALKFLVGEHYPAVNIITDEFSLKDYALFVKDIDIVIFMGNKKIFPIRSGFSKWKQMGEEIVLMNNRGPDPDNYPSIKISGLIFKGPDVLETVKDGFYSLSFAQPFIFIAENI